MGLLDDKVENSYDSLFDYDRDGELDTFERASRDADFWQKVEASSSHDKGEGEDYTYYTVKPGKRGDWESYAKFKKELNEEIRDRSGNRNNGFCIVFTIILVLVIMSLIFK